MRDPRHALDRLRAMADLGRAGVFALSNALGWGLPLYEGEPGLFAREQMAAMGMRMGLGWLAELDLDLMADP